MHQQELIATGIYASPWDAARAINGLEARGFIECDVSILMSDSHGFGRQSGEGSPTDKGIGPEVGVLAALMGGLTLAGALATSSGVGVLMAGPFLAVAGGLAPETDGHDALVAALVNCGIPSYDAELFAREIGTGKVLVAVRSRHPDGHATAERVLANAGAETTSRV
jgi:hypothetical protein